MNNIKKALLSVWDKTGIVELAKFLHDNNVEIISTGGTKKMLKSAGIPVKSVSAITGQKEVMNGRVKTLHPHIFAGILADRKNENHMQDLINMGANTIDMVVINLYPFKEEAINNQLPLEQAIEYIDIGGPSMLRAASKNFESIITLSDPYQYDEFIKSYMDNNGLIPREERLKYATKVFSLTYKYDQMVAKYFNDQNETNEKDSLDFTNDSYIKDNSLRYGENPHQNSDFYVKSNSRNIINQLHGKELSYNNYFDMESAINIVYGFKEISCVIIKHSNPCGFGLGNNNKEAYLRAVSTDPISYFGGIVAFNYKVDYNVAIELNKSFLECIVAPSFSDKSLELLKSKKNIRLITIEKRDLLYSSAYHLKSVFNGILSQKKDEFMKNEKDFEIVSKRKPSKKEFNALLLGWKLVKFVKSNAIVFNNHEQLLGVGAGQMSRIDSVKIAIRKSSENGLNLAGSMLASDAFFPFSDSIIMANKAGISGVIQPGGSIKDEEVIKVIDDLNLIMIFTKERHFLH